MFNSREGRAFRPDIRLGGAGTPEEYKQILRELQAAFRGERHPLIQEEDWLFAKEHEIEKTPQDLTAIRVANTMTNEVREKCGLAPFDVLEKNVLILPDGAYEKIGGEIEDKDHEVATSDTETQKVAIREKIAREYPLHSAFAIVHEIIHQKSVVSFQIPGEPTEQDELLKKAIPYREGLSAYATAGKVRSGEDHEHFVGLDEAIVENFVMRRKNQILNDPAFTAEKTWLSSQEAERIKKRIAKREKIPPDEVAEEVAWVAPNGKGQPWSYRSQRKILYYCAQEIAAQFPNNFSSPENVIDVFEEGVFVAPRILTIGRYIEQTFGKGAFRRIGDMTDVEDDPENSKIMSELKQRRANKLRELET